jgi:hypothetical protein
VPPGVTASASNSLLLRPPVLVLSTLQLRAVLK